MFLPLWILGISEWTPSNQLDSFFRGLVAACGISVLCNLMRVYYYIQQCSDSEIEGLQRSSSAVKPLTGSWRTSLHFWSMVILFSLVGSRVSSLIVLEFSLRAVSARASAELDANGRGLDLLLVQCQFSLGCGLTSTLDFLHRGAPQTSLSLFLAAALSWAVATISQNLWNHVGRLYKLHSTERYCGKCITLLTSGHAILASLQGAVVLAFALGIVASTTMVYDHFLSQKDALKFWTPLTLCYIMLVFYIQENQNRQTGSEALLHTVVLRLGALLVLMLTIGDWSDVLHILIAFLGEAVCLLPSRDLLQAVLKEEEDTTLSKFRQKARKGAHRTLSHES